MLVREKIVLSVWATVIVAVLVITFGFEKPLLPETKPQEKIWMLPLDFSIPHHPVYGKIKEDVLSRKLTLKPKMTFVESCAYNESENQNRVKHTFLILREKFASAQDLKIFLSAACSYLTTEAQDPDLVPDFETLCYTLGDQHYFSLMATLNSLNSDQTNHSKCGYCQDDFCYTDFIDDFYRLPEGALNKSCNFLLDENNTSCIFCLSELLQVSPTLPSLCKRLQTFEEMSYYYMAHDIILSEKIKFRNKNFLLFNLNIISYSGASLFSILFLSILYTAPFNLPGNHCLVFHALFCLITNLANLISYTRPDNIKEENLLDIAINSPFPYIASVVWITLYSYDCCLTFSTKGRITDEMKAKAIKTYHIIAWLTTVFISATYYIFNSNNMIYSDDLRMWMYLNLINCSWPRFTFYLLFFVLNFKAARKIRATIKSTKIAATALNDRKKSLKLVFLRLVVALDFLNDVAQAGAVFFPLHTPLGISSIAFMDILGEPVLYSIFHFAPHILMLKRPRNNAGNPIEMRQM